MKYLLSSALALSVALVPSVASAAVSFGFSPGIGGGGGFGNSCASTVCAVAGNLLYLINFVLVPLIFALAFIVFLWGVAKAYIFSNGDASAVSQGHRLILWGIIGFVVMVSLWGLVNVVANTFSLSGFAAPPTPTSYPVY